MAVVNKIQTRDFLRMLARQVRDKAGLTGGLSLNSKEECVKYILDVVEQLKTSKTDENLKAKYEKLDTDFKKLKKGNLDLYADNAHLTARCKSLEEKNLELEAFNEKLLAENREQEKVIKNQKNTLTNICVENSEKDAKIQKLKNDFNEKNKFAFKLDLIASVIKVIILFCACLLVGEVAISKIVAWFF